MKRSLVLGPAAMLTAAALFCSPTFVRADDQLVAKAKKLVSEATSGLVASIHPKKPELELTIDDFQPVTGWVGPQTSAKAPEHKKIVAIACVTVAPFCANVTQGAVEAAKALGWDATYIDGKGSSRGLAKPSKPRYTWSRSGTTHGLP